MLPIWRNKTNLQKLTLKRHKFQLLDRDFKMIVLNMLKELKENDKELKQIRKTIYEQNKNQTEIRDLKNTVTELKILPDGFNNRLSQTEERISELEHR